VSVEATITAPAAGPGEGPARAMDPLAGALQEFFRALHKTAMYPPGHPSIRGAIARAAEQIRMGLEGRASVRLGIARDHLVIDRTPVSEGPAVLASLAHFLHGLDVGILELRAGVEAEELGRFLFLLREGRRSGWRGAALAGAVKDAQLAHFVIVPLDYDGLSFSQHVDAQRSSAESQGVWDGLVMNLAELAKSGTGTEPESLAQEANLRFVNDEGVGGGLLRREIQSLGVEMREMDSGPREALRNRLGRFVQALNPALRQDLLRLDPQDADGSLTMVAELSDALPDTTLLDILRDLNRTGQRAHDQFLGFLNKMARLPGDGAAMPDLVSALNRWGSSGIIEENSQSFRTALKAVLTRRQVIDCNPEAYQNHLDGLTRREISPTGKMLCARYRDPADRDDVRAQVVELAVHLLADGEGLEHVPGIIAHVGVAADRLIETGWIVPVRDAAQVIRNIQASGGQSPEVQRAASGFLTDFHSNARIDRILDLAERAGNTHGTAEALLALGGARALDRVLVRLPASAETGLTALLTTVAASLGRAPLTELIEHRWGAGFAGLEPVFRLLRVLPQKDTMALLDELAAHPEARVRREVLAQRCELDAKNVERHLRQALCDPDAGFVNLVVARLASRTTKESLETLGHYVEGLVTPTLPQPALIRRGAEGLVERGDVGLHRLSGSLNVLSVGLKPSRAVAGAVVCAVLEPHAANPLVQRALAGWRRSPARLVARLFGGKIEQAEHS